MRNSASPTPPLERKSPAIDQAASLISLYCPVEVRSNIGFGQPLVQALVFIAAAAILVVVNSIAAPASVPRNSWLLRPALAWRPVFSVSLLGKSSGRLFPNALFARAGHCRRRCRRRHCRGRQIQLVEPQPGLARDMVGARLEKYACRPDCGHRAYPATAFALLSPALRRLGEKSTAARPSITMAPALAISAGHGLILFSPVPIAAASILGAHWDRVALFGLPLAVVLAVFGIAWAQWFSPSGEAKPSATDNVKQQTASSLACARFCSGHCRPIASPDDPIPRRHSKRTARRRHRSGKILGMGRPLILFLVGIGIMVAGHWRLSVKLLADTTWTESIFAKVAGVLLTVGAAGGLQKLCQETGMAELIGERVAGLHGGVLIAFLVAAVIKTLQGSSLVAAIAAAGMIQPSLASLGIGCREWTGARHARDRRRRDDLFSRQ